MWQNPAKATFDTKKLYESDISPKCCESDKDGSKSAKKPVHRSLISKFSLKIAEIFAVFFPKIRKFCQNFAEFSPNLTKFFRDFSKMQHFRNVIRWKGLTSKHYTQLSPYFDSSELFYMYVYFEAYSRTRCIRTRINVDLTSV